MYAIVNIAGKQFKVSQNQYIYAPRMATHKAGDSVEFDQVLLTGNDNGVQVGSPALDGVRVAASVVEHVRGDKVIVFKKKRRKGYKKTRGHRQDYTKIMIDEILAKGQTASPKQQREEAPAEQTSSEVEQPTQVTQAERTQVAETQTEQAPDNSSQQEPPQGEPAPVLPGNEEITPEPVPEQDETKTDSSDEKKV